VKTLTQNVREMTRKSDEIYNSKFSASGSSSKTPINLIDFDLPGPVSKSVKHSGYMSYILRDSSSGGKVGPHGPRRVAKPSVLFKGDFEIGKVDFTASSSELKNYKEICSLASSKHSKYGSLIFLCYLSSYSSHPFVRI
jgi:hypothetical protein